MALPMKSKKAKEVVATVVEFVLRLRSDVRRVSCWEDPFRSRP